MLSFKFSEVKRRDHMRRWRQNSYYFHPNTYRTLHQLFAHFPLVVELLHAQVILLWSILTLVFDSSFHDKIDSSLNKWVKNDKFGFINCPPRLRCCRGWGRGWGWNREQNALGWFAWLYKKSKKSCFLMAFSYFNIRTRSVQVQDALRPWKIFFRRDWSLESLLIQKVLIQKKLLNRWFDLWHFMRFSNRHPHFEILPNSSACSVPSRFAQMHRVLFAKTNAAQVEPSSPSSTQLDLACMHWARLFRLAISEVIAKWQCDYSVATVYRDMFTSSDGGAFQFMLGDNLLIVTSTTLLVKVNFKPAARLAKFG